MVDTGQVPRAAAADGQDKDPGPPSPASLAWPPLPRSPRKASGPLPRPDCRLRAGRRPSSPCSDGFAFVRRETEGGRRPRLLSIVGVTVGLGRFSVGRRSSGRRPSILTCLQDGGCRAFTLKPTVGMKLLCSPVFPQ